MSTTSKPAVARTDVRLDPRGPRFVAGVTAITLLVTIGLFLGGATVAAFVVFAYVTLLFLWGAVAGIQRGPYSVFFRKVIRPRLSPPTETESAIPPTFAQGVGLLVTAVGLVLFLVGLPLALPIAAAFAFVAAFLNSVFGYCLGCQIYLLLVRAGILGRGASTTA